MEQTTKDRVGEIELNNLQDGSFAEETTILYKQQYSDGIIALIIKDKMGMPVCTPSVNLTEEVHGPKVDEYLLKEDDEYIAIKNYSENEGILEDLVEADVVAEPVDEVHSGHVMIPICPLKV